jgi:hypothetical protein
MASGASTCNGLLIEGGEVSRYARYAIHAKFRLESGNEQERDKKVELPRRKHGIKTGEVCFCLQFSENLSRSSELCFGALIGEFIGLNDF